MNQAFHLYQLQKVDIQISNIQARMDEIDKLISKDKRIREVEERIQITKNDLEKLKKKLRELEEIGKEIRLEIETNESSMYSGKIRNPKELADLEAKINSDKRIRDKNDDKQLESMLEIETHEEDLSKLGQLLTQVKTKVATSNSLLLGEKTQLQKQKETYETERFAKVGSITRESLEIYSQLIKQKHGVAVAHVEDRSCESCGAPLTPGEWQSVRSSMDLVYCSTCGRILYAS